MNIPSVPETISRDTVVDLLHSWNIDPEDLLFLEMTPDRIKTEVYARDKDGSPYVVTDGAGLDEVATHVVTTRIV